MPVKKDRVGLLTAALRSGDYVQGQYQKAENKRLSDEYSRQARERWERIEREYREKARAVIPGMTEAQFNLLNTIFRDYHWEW